MLRLILNGHSKVRIPSEAWFIGDLLRDLPLTGPLSKAQLQQACKIILSNDRWKDWNCSDDLLRETVLDAEGETLGGLIDRLFRSCAGIGSKPIWGEKSPKHSYCVTQLNEVFPKARFLHLVRDGRDVCAAMLSRGWYEGSVRRCAMSWDGSVRAASAAGSFGPGRYLEVRFENLILQPEVEVRKICQFLEVEYEARMLDYTLGLDQEIQTWENAIHEKLRQAPDVKEIGRSRDLTACQLLQIEAVAGATLRRAGYRSLCPWWLSWAVLPCRALCGMWQRWLELKTKFTPRTTAWIFQAACLSP